ncbi:hypothetical protein N7491_010874 [Penicillium cf. griseofulvum]|uniref:Zn(2)-C6 fungal-type domain-containing protein n=1 Tax=Penicillium cf. griseofulvum TaxID=2972120 RepID=A0A9W9N1J2_9EURO|nr:hypothetical protein N7472_001197 [Penicillium cf. griseofulvum]KAJ5422429.1 hypothetical protein N7491_010874 [Penicillium cf. griseofulvum]
MAHNSGRSAVRWQNEVPKLRSTCDRCMMLKVRCDKRKPQCERCEAIQAICVYSPYRWKGKSSTQHQPLSNKTIEANTGPTPSDLRSRNQEQARKDTVQSTEICNLEIHDVVPDYAGLLAGVDKEDLPGGNETDTLEDWYAQCMDIDQLGPIHIQADDTSNLRAFGGSDTSLSEVSDSSSRGKGLTCSCPTMAITALQNMFSSELECQESAINPGLTPGDHIVKVNRVTMQHLERILRCGSGTCTRDPTVLFMVMALFSKVLAGYHSAFVAFTREPCPSQSADLSHSVLGSFLRPCSATPIRFWDLALDFSSEQRMKAQFLLCEVQKLSLVFDLAKARPFYHAQYDGSQELGSHRRSSPTSAVQQFLSAELDVLITLIKDYCITRPPI